MLAHHMSRLLSTFHLLTVLTTSLQGYGRVKQNGKITLAEKLRIFCCWRLIIFLPIVPSAYHTIYYRYHYRLSLFISFFIYF